VLTLDPAHDAAALLLPPSCDSRPGVYEEEVYGGPSALWFSPSGKHLAFLAFNESRVPTFTYPVYDPEHEGGARPYPKVETIAYPKPGYANPTVEAYVFSLADHFGSSSRPEEAALSTSVRQLSWPNRRKPEDEVVFEVAWVGPTELLVRSSDRSAAEGNVVRFDVAAGGRAAPNSSKLAGLEGKVVRTLSGGDGWLEHVRRKLA
jgi:dipeptidyl aminopeptidase